MLRVIVIDQYEAENIGYVQRIFIAGDPKSRRMVILTAPHYALLFLSTKSGKSYTDNALN